MIFLALILCLLLQRFGHVGYYGQFEAALHRYFQWTQTRLGASVPFEKWLGVILWVLIPTAIIFSLNYLLQLRSGYFSIFFFNLIFLWICMDVATHPQGLTASYHRIFAVLFWFWLFHATGAVFYFTLYQANSGMQLVDQKGHSWLQFLMNIADWLPVRLLGLSFALMGHFSDTYRLWSADVLTVNTSADALLTKWAKASLYEITDETVSALTDRCVLVWVVVISLLSI